MGAILPRDTHFYVEGSAKVRHSVRISKNLWNLYVDTKPETLLKCITVEKKQGRYHPSIKVVQFKVEYDRLLEWSFNLGGRFSAILGDEYRFDSFDGILKSYSDAFDTIFTQFDINIDRSLFNLAQTRNAIVHGAGCADEQFIRTMVNIKCPWPEFAGIKEGEIVPIDGKVVARLVGESIGSIVGLVKEIDSLL